MLLQDRFRSFLPVVVDVETGGTDAGIHALLEIAIVLLRLENDLLAIDAVHSWNVTPHPATATTKASLDFTQIDPNDAERHSIDEDIAVRECFRTIRRAINTANCTRGVLTGHNAHFDHGFLFRAAERNKIGRNPFHPFTVIDTASLSAVALGHTTLPEAASRLGIDYNEIDAHSAVYDAEITAKVFCELVNRSGYPSAD